MLADRRGLQNKIFFELTSFASTLMSTAVKYAYVTAHANRVISTKRNDEYSSANG